MTDEQRSQTGWIGVLGWFRDRNYESGYLVPSTPSKNSGNQEFKKSRILHSTTQDQDWLLMTT
jgi:hypothetical protein